MLPGDGSAEVHEPPGNSASDCTQAAQPVGGATSCLAPPGAVVEVCSGPRPGPAGPCPHCGQPRPQTTAARPSGPLSANLHGSSQSVSSRRRQSGDSLSRPAATDNASFLGLVLACLSCQCSAVLLGLLEACSSCLHLLCSCCCGGCARCCAAVQEAPVEELNCHAHCHAVVFESCCESTECLEFCLDCCLICHHS